MFKTTRNTQRHISNSSNFEDSMDEGLVVKYAVENGGQNKSGSMIANSIDDVDEHPNPQPQFQR